VPDRREFNDYRVLIFGTDEHRPIAFVCECDDEGCARTVVLSRPAYEDLRRQGKPILFHAHLVGVTAD
jgi:hypothetical protein